MAEWLGAVLAVVLLPALAAGQPGGFVPDRHYELSPAVQLDRAEGNVLKAFEQAKAYLADKQYSEGIDILMQVMDASGGKLVAVTPTRYLPVRDACQRQIVGLPREALAIYRRRVDPQAKRLYQEGLAQRDRRRLLGVVDEYFASSWTAKALDALGEMALESGDPAAARSYWERALQSTIGPIGPIANSASLGDPSYAAIRARLVLASILEGSTARAKDELARFAKLHADARGWLGGRQVRYTDALSAMIAESAQWPQPAPRGDWPTFAGSPSRNAIAAKVPDVAGPAWRVPLGQARPDRMSYFPIVWGTFSTRPDPLERCPTASIVFVNRGNEDILALDVSTGRPAWGRTPVIYQDDIEEDEQSKTLRQPQGLGIARFTATVFGDRLYARMGGPVTSRPRGAAPLENEGYVVCLDLTAQGRLMWKAMPEPGWAFEGSPLADASGVYVAMRRSDVQPRAYVACLDPETGQLRWRQFICAADTPARGVLPEITHNLLTLHRDTLYVNTNLGAIASLGTRDGRLHWISLYPRDLKGDLTKPPPHARRDLTPCLFDRGQLLVAPADARSIFALDAASGQVLWQSPPGLEDAIHLLGVSHDYLIASGSRLYWIGLKQAEQGRVKHVWPDGSARLGYGRGLLAGDCVLWPTREKIYVFDQATARPKRVIDLMARGVRGGNLLVAGGYLLIATPGELIALGTTNRTYGTNRTYTSYNSYSSYSWSH